MGWKFRFAAGRRVRAAATLGLAAGLLVVNPALALEAGQITPGQIAPPEVIESLRGQAPLRAGGALVRPVPQGLPALAARPQGEAAESTLVISENSGLVGLSHHELAVTGVDPARVEALVRQILPNADVRVFPALSLTMIRTSAFADLAPLAQRLEAELPGAGVNAPIQWALPRLQ